MSVESSRTLSEAESKNLLGEFDVRFAQELRSHSAAEAVEAAQSIGFPVALKLNGDGISHKTCLLYTSPSPRD